MLNEVCGVKHPLWSKDNGEFVEVEEGVFKQDAVRILRLRGLFIKEIKFFDVRKTLFDVKKLFFEVEKLFFEVEKVFFEVEKVFFEVEKVFL